MIIAGMYVIMATPSEQTLFFCGRPGSKIEQPVDVQHNSRRPYRYECRYDNKYRGPGLRDPPRGRGSGVGGRGSGGSGVGGRGSGVGGRGSGVGGQGSGDVGGRGSGVGGRGSGVGGRGSGIGVGGRGSRCRTAGTSTSTYVSPIYSAAGR